MTAFSKWLRIGQPGVVSDTITLTAPCGSISIERTMSSSTIDRRSSGSITVRRAVSYLFFGGHRGYQSS